MVRQSMDRLSFACLAILVTIPAWVFGGVQASVQTWMLWVALGGVACGAARLLLSDPHDVRPSTVPWLAYVLIASLAFGAFQLVPWSQGVLQTISPTTVEWWTNWGGLDAETPLPISTYPAGTRKDMSTLTLILSSLILGSLSLNTSFRRLAICGLLAANGAVMAFMGMIQQLTSEAGTIYWNVPLTFGGTPFAGFINRNNGAGYLNMCLGLSIGFLLWSMTRFTLTLPADRDGRRDRQRPRPRGAEIFASLDTVSISAAAATIFIAAGVLSTLSRGGAIAMLGAVIVTVLVAAHVHRGLIGAGGLIGVTLIGLALTVWLGRAELLQERFERIFATESLAESEPRILHWQDALKAINDFPVVGSGMGTYRFAYEPYDTRGSTAWYLHAENQYLEAALEGGIIGLSLLLLCIVVAVWSSYRMLRSAIDSENHAFGFAVLFALATQVIHGCFDFGLYMPSNAVLLAAICGGTGPLAYSQLGLFGRSAEATEKWLSIALAQLVIVAGLFGVRELAAVASIEEISRDIRRLDSPDSQSASLLRKQIDNLQTALSRRQDDAEAQYRQARLWVTLYRVEAVAQMKDSLPYLNHDELLGITSLERLFLQAQDPERRQQLVEQPLVRNCLGQAWRHLQWARRGCPEMAKVHLLMAQLCPLFDDPEQQAEYLRIVLESSPGDPDDLYDIGVLKLYAGDTDEAIKLWKRVLLSTKAYRKQMIEVGMREIGAAELYGRLLDGSPNEIVDVAVRQYRGDQNQVLRLELVAHAERQLLADESLESARRDYLFGMIAQVRQDWPAAVEAYKRAVKRSPSNLDWRYLLAKAYMRLDRPNYSQAKLHAQLGQRLSGPAERRFSALLTTIESKVAPRKKAK